MRDIMAKNPNNFRLMGPDETASNRLQNVYEVTKKAWMADFYPEDLDGSELSQDGRVMEMLSEHTLQGLAGRVSTHWPPRLLPHL